MEQALTILKGIAKVLNERFDALADTHRLVAIAVIVIVGLILINSSFLVALLGYVYIVAVVVGRVAYKNGML